jgi:hypothetical protein
MTGYVLTAAASLARYWSMASRCAGSVTYRRKITGSNSRQKELFIECQENGGSKMKAQKCRRCKKKLLLTTDNFRFTRGYFQHICCDCEAKLARWRYRRKKKRGLIRPKRITRRDISAVIAKYRMIFRYLAAMRIDPVTASAFEVDKVLSKSAAAM